MKMFVLVLCALSVACMAEAKPARAQVVISGQSNKVISGQHYTNSSGDCLWIINSTNITVEDSDFSNCFGVGIRVEGSTNVKIGVWQHGNTFNHINGGVYALNSKQVQVAYNDFRDVHNDWANSSRGQFVQFDKVSGPGNFIRGNTGGNVVGSNPEDLINLWVSTGTAASPIDVAENCFENPVGAATSGSGSGILLGDGGGSYQYAHSNILINPGQVGIGIAGGTNIQALFNRIYGAQDVETNVGIYAWNQWGGSCGPVWYGRNSIDFTNANGVANPGWDAGNCTETDHDNMWASNDSAATLSALHCPAFNGH